METVLGRIPASVQQGSFEGQLLKGIVENGRLRELRREDMESGTRPDSLMVSQVLNLEINWNRDPLQNPPPRTGMFSPFKDEVEDVAALAGCRHV